MQNFIPFLVHTCSPSRFSSVQFTSSVVSDSLRPHGLQHARPPCPSSTPRVYSNSCPLSPWSHPTISSSVFSSCLQPFPASGSFPMSQFFASGGQSIGISASASVLPMNIQDWFPLGWTGWISLQSKGFSRVSSSTTVQKHPSVQPSITVCWWARVPSHCLLSGSLSYSWTSDSLLLWPGLPFTQTRLITEHLLFKRWTFWK